jgi:GAF domain-containing protein/HAMP domain-containing protein
MTMETKNKKNRPARSLAVTIAIAFLTLSVLILLASGGFQLLFNVQAQQQALSSQQQLTAQDAAKTVNNFIQQNFSLLSTAVSLVRPNTISPANQAQFLNSLLANQPSFRQFAIFDPQNKNTSFATRTQSASTKVITSLVTADILALTRNGQKYISPVYFDVANNEPLVLMGIPVLNALGEFQGTLVGELNLISTWNLVNQIKVGNTGYAYVVDSKGKLLAYKDTARAFKGEDTSKIKPVSEFILKPLLPSTKGAEIYYGINGSLVVGTYVPLISPEWAVVTELPWQEAYRQSIQVGVTSLAIILVLAAVAVVVGIRVARRLTVPITELTATAAAIAAGDLKQRAAVKGGLEPEALANAFNHMTDQLQGLIGGLEERITERTQVLEARSLEVQNAAQIVREISNIQDIDTLLDRVAILIKARFGYYHTGIFLIDDNEEYAVLKAAAGDAGQLMLASKHKLKVGETGIVGHVAQTGEARISLDVGTDDVHFQNRLLPYTRSEMALPLKIADRVIGVLDIQSDKTNAFDQNNISVMQIVTDQISIGVEKTQLFQSGKQNASELELTIQENTYRTWRNYLGQKEGFVGYQYDGVTIEALTTTSANVLKEMQKGEPDAMEKGEIVISGNTLGVPIQLRGQTLGTLQLQFQTPEISKETLRMVKEAVDRLALALENARLVAEAQQRADRERMISQVTTRMRETLDIETILKTAVKEIRQSLDLTEAEVRLQLARENHPTEVAHG